MKRRVAKRARRKVGSKAKRQWKAKVARVAKRVTLQNSELKFGVQTGSAQLYQEGSSTLSQGAPYVVGITSSVLPGDEQTERVGREITLKGCAFRVSFNRPTDENPDALGQNLYLRVMVVRLKRNILNGGAGSGVNQYQNSNIFYGVTVPLVNAFLRKERDPTSRIEHVYWDKTYQSLPHSVMSEAVDTYKQPVHDRHVKFYVPFHNMKFLYDESIGTGNGANSDIVMFMSAYNVLAAPQTAVVCEMQYEFKLWWKDA